MSTSFINTQTGTLLVSTIHPEVCDCKLPPLLNTESVQKCLTALEDRHEEFVLLDSTTCVHSPAEALELLEALNGRLEVADRQLVVYGRWWTMMGWFETLNLPWFATREEAIREALAASMPAELANTGA
ncbi:MAG: hypothetical protein KDA90_22570 [Planctomycetaceae bacterium]|nr:hypothetical protein [Planctomycetaceae bacterium]